MSDDKESLQRCRTKVVWVRDMAGDKIQITFELLLIILIKEQNNLQGSKCFYRQPIEHLIFILASFSSCTQSTAT